LIAKRGQVSVNTVEDEIGVRTVGQKVADQVAVFGGS
jgi:uncharacterized membrane protein